MPTWAIVLIVAVVVLFLFFHFRKKPVIKSSTAGIGVQLRKAAEGIPVYGSVVKAVGVVGKPVNSALDRVNKGITTGLQHIPVAGKYLAMPNQIAGSAVKKVNDWLGL
jgi:hypothetical protein